MKKLLLSTLVFSCLQAPAQTLFTIGDDSVSVPEFLYAYRKNNAGAHSAKALNDYLQLYIASKLKVKEAKSRGYDTLEQFRSDLSGLRSQVLPTYLSDPAAVRQLAEEAFMRSQKDLKIAHIFISSVNAAGEKDTAAAQKRALEAYSRLQEGASFAAVARQYSDDPSAAANGGSLGFITVFLLPYELENLAYSTPVGQLAPMHRSAAGYHILKVDAERKAKGRIQAAQILLAYPPNPTAAEKLSIRKRADSLYLALKKGASFAALAEKFSNDPVSAGAGGAMPEFGIGQYDKVFEETVFGLPQDNAFSVPFETEHGIHIVKRVKLVPAPAQKTEAVLQALREKVQQSDRMATTKQQLVQKVLQQAGYKEPSATMQAALRSHIRQALQGQIPADALPGQTVLFRLGNELYTVDQFLQFARTFYINNDGSGERPFEQLWQEYVADKVMEHYQQHLEMYNPDFRNQMAEFKEGNLFFEIMQREVWAPVQIDSAGQRRFYEANKAAYRWNRSADAVLFYAPDAATARKLAAQVQKAPARWRQLASQYADAVTTDSARFEWSSLPGLNAQSLKKGAVGKVQVSEADGTANFALVLQVHNQPVQRSFEEARGAVINDYQAQKERDWLESLRKKYPVRINEEVLRNVAQIGKEGGLSGR